jgi:hypothetical protein
MNLSEGFKKFVGIVEEGVNDVAAVGKATVAATDINYNQREDWADHVVLDASRTKPHFDSIYGGHTREARNAGSFYGGYDAASRFPDKLEELKTLAKGYQVWSGIIRSHKKDASFADEMEDAVANIAGIEAAQKDIQAGKKHQAGTELDEDITGLARQYADQKRSHKE